MRRTFLAAVALLASCGIAYAATFPLINPAQCMIPGVCQDINGFVVAPGNGTLCTASGATPQTCNGTRGIVTTNSLSTAAVTNAAFVINNSLVTAASAVSCVLSSYSGTLVTNGVPVILTCVPGAGIITVNIYNAGSANALSGTLNISFTVNQN